MKKQSILLILFLLLTLLSCTGCQAVPEKTAPTEDTAVSEAAEEKVSEDSFLRSADTEESVEDVVGVFEGLEDNHTAVFSFDGAETAFYFEDASVQNVLYEAVTGSHYTLSYQFNSELGLNVIYEISE